MATGPRAAVGIANSVMAWVARVDLADLVGGELGEPDVAVRARAQCPSGPPPAVGVGNSEIAPVAGLISAILLALISANHRLPSGPGDDSLGPAAGVGVANSLI